MKFSWRTEWPLWAMLAGMFLLAAAAWPTAPDRIPVHWGLSGDVDRYGGKFEGLLLLPLIALGIYFIFLVIPKLDPGGANYPHFAGAYTVFRFGVITVLALINGVVHLWIRGYRPAIGALVPFFIGALFLLLGAVMGKIRPNWFVGIRTPWTLSSKRSWTRTHRMAGWVFFVMGSALVGAAVFGRPAGFVAAVAIGLCGMLVTIVYSYLVWRKDPDRVPPAGTLPAD